MRCTLSREALKNALEQIKAGLPSLRQKLDGAYYTVLIEATERGVFVTALGRTMRLTTRAGEPLAVSVRGACAVSYGKFYEAIKALPRQAALTLILQGEVLHINDRQGGAVLACYPPEAFPKLAPSRAVGETYLVEDRWTTGQGLAIRVHTTMRAYEVLDAHGQELTIGRDAFRDAFLSVAYAAARDDSRPVFTGVYVDLREGHLTLVASDAFRLAKRRHPLPEAGEWGHPLLIPSQELAKALELLPAGSRLTLTSRATTDRLVNENGRTVADAEPFLNPAQVQLASDEGANVAGIQLIAGQYPDVDKFIPTELPTRVVCETAALREALLDVAPIAKLASNRMTFTIEQGATLWIAAQNMEHARPEWREVAASITGPAVKIDLDCQYVLGALDASSSPEIALELISGTKPCVISPTREDEVSCQHIIMPMFRDR